MSQRYHKFFSCFEKGKTENNKWNTLWNVWGSNMRKILFAGNMDIWCHNSRMAKPADDFSTRFPLSERGLHTLISNKRKLVKKCQKINTEHLNSFFSLWQATKEPPTHQYTFRRSCWVATHHLQKIIFYCLHFLPRKGRRTQNTIHWNITRIFPCYHNALYVNLVNTGRGEDAWKEKLRHHIVMISPL